MILVTGGAGFIGSVLVGYLNSLGIEDIVISDIIDDEKLKNLSQKKFRKIISIDEPIDDVSFIIHLGADSNTLQKDWKTIYDLNIASTRGWFEYSKNVGIPMIFSSSAAIYGNGNGPLNLYAFSKKASEAELENVAILRLFNVYGPNEYHKCRMASTIYHWYQQLKDSDHINLFENSKNFFRDFVYVKDVAKIIHYFMENFQSGTYDIGSGYSRSFENIADIVITATGNGSKNYIEMPNDLKHQYQTNTLADLTALEKSGFNTGSLLSPEQGILEYVSYLRSREIY